MQQLLFLLALVFSLISCSPDAEDPEKQYPESVAPVPHMDSAQGCLACHAMQLDPSHDFVCTVCHKGNDKTEDKQLSHKGLIAEPAHPANMMESCGTCHQPQVEESSHSLHFTITNMVNLVRFAFGAKKELLTLTDIPVVESPETILQLSDDMLRRRCLRCHVYSTGDRYPAVVRGTGCAGCHLSFYEGKLISHSFIKKPADTQCLQCHYGNHVGFDYYGRYDHDMNDEYRTPYTTPGEYFRPFGIEYHQLIPDIHQQHGMSCVDCHSGSTLMGGATPAISCSSCHDLKKLKEETPANIQIGQDGVFILTTVLDDKKHILPLMQHPAHQKYQNIAGCQVCHGRWSFNDLHTNLLRRDTEEYDDFSRLTVQGSFEVEKILTNNLDYKQDELDPQMSDKITRELRSGLWHKGYISRRWEQVTFGRDSTGILQVVRPILDLTLSWIDADGTIQFDAVHTNTKNIGMLPYVPHTTGKAGLFYEERIQEFLQSENGNNE